VQFNFDQKETNDIPLDKILESAIRETIKSVAAIDLLAYFVIHDLLRLIVAT
jgi:hypothetical protein